MAVREKCYLASTETTSFPLQAGSDYATPNPPNIVGVEGKVADFDFPGGYTGTLSLGGKDDFNSKPIFFAIFDNGMPQFNEDFQIDIYGADQQGQSLYQVGMVNVCTVTIPAGQWQGGILAYLPAGSVDELYNADFGQGFLRTLTSPPQMSHPGHGR